MVLARPTSPDARRHPDGPSPAAARRALVAGASQRIRRLLRTVLEVGGFDVVEAATDSECLECLGRPSQTPQVVVVDLAAPRRSGVPELAFLRRERRLSSVPVVVLTSPADPPDPAHLQRFGPVTLIDKPFRMRHLLETLEALAETVHG